MAPAALEAGYFPTPALDQQEPTCSEVSKVSGSHWAHAEAAHTQTATDAIPRERLLPSRWDLRCEAVVGLWEVALPGRFPVHPAFLSC